MRRRVAIPTACLIVVLACAVLAQAPSPTPLPKTPLPQGVLTLLANEVSGQMAFNNEVRLAGAPWMRNLSEFSGTLYEAQAIYDLVRGSRPEVSVAGIALAAAALVVMPVLSVMKKGLGRRLDNSALVADGAESMFCGVLAGVLLLGLALNAAFGWWWADAVAALVVAVFAVREGWEAWEESSPEAADEAV